MSVTSFAHVRSVRLRLSAHTLTPFPLYPVSDTNEHTQGQASYTMNTIAHRNLSHTCLLNASYILHHK